MNTAPTTIVPPSTAFMSALNSESCDVAAEARPGEDGLGQHGAFEQLGVAQRDHRDQRHHDVAERVAPDDARAATGP